MVWGQHLASSVILIAIQEKWMQAPPALWLCLFGLLAAIRSYLGAWEVALRWGNKVFFSLCAAQGSAVWWIELGGSTE